MADTDAAGGSRGHLDPPAEVVQSPVYYRGAPDTLVEAIETGQPLRQSGWGIPDFFFAVAMWLFFGVLAFGIADALGEGEGATNIGILLGMTLPWVGLAGWPLLVARLRGNGPVIDFGLKVKAADIGWGIGFGLLAMFLGGLVGLITQFFFGEFTAAAADVATDLSFPALVVFAVLVAVGAPIVEELAFRGLLFGALVKRGLGPWIAIVISALAFSLFHFEPVRLGVLFTIGLVLGFARYYRGNTTTAIVGHMMNNTPAALVLLFMG
jgi:uncharacterized protein